MSDFKAYFTKRALQAAVEQWKEPQTFFLDSFFREIKEYSTRVVEINFFDEKRRIAPFIARNGTGQFVEKQGYTKFLYEPPYVKPKMSIEPNDLQEALIDETIYDEGNSIEKMRNGILKNLDNMITRREELMAIQTIFDKQVDIINENGTAIQDSITYTRDASLEFSAASAWSSSTHNPLIDIRKARRLIGKLTGLNADIAIHGSDNADAFIHNAKIESMLTAPNINIGTLTEMARQMGVNYLGTLAGVDHFAYDAYYFDPITETEKAMIPAGKTLVASRQARGIRHYGAIETLSPPFTRGRRFPKFYTTENQDPEVMGIQLHSAPLPAMHQPNAFAIISGAT